MYDSQSKNKSWNAKSETTHNVSATIIIDGREFTTYRMFFHSKKSAAEVGYYPKSYWSKLGREIVEVQKPALVVIKSWRTFHPADDEMVLAYSLVNEYLVTADRFFADLQSRGCWEVYLESQTVPKQLVNKCKQPKTASPKKEQKQNAKKTKKRRKESTTKTTTTPPTISPYDVANIINSDANDRQDKELGTAATQTRLIGKPRAGEKFKVYFPEGFNWDKHPQLVRYRSSVMWLANKIYERRFLNAEGVIHDKDAFIVINSKIARAIDPKFTSMVKLLLGLIIERDFYEPRVKSYGYRLVDPQLRHAEWRYVPLDDPKMVARINRHRQQEMSTRTDRWLYSQLFQLALTEIDEEFLTKVAATSNRESGGNIEDKLDAYHYWLERIGRKDHIFQPDDQGRRYSIPTNMKRELRSLLRVNGQRLQQIDIRNSQWTFLALEMRRKGIECQDYFDACERGELYETVAKAAKSDREKVKKLLTQRALFSANDAPCQRTKIKKTFDKLFPEVAKFLIQAKTVKRQEQKAGSRLAKTLQSAEAELIIGKVCGRLRREGRVKFVTPIHDCLIFLPEDGDYVMAVMEEEFGKLGIRPKLEPKDL